MGVTTRARARAREAPAAGPGEAEPAQSPPPPAPTPAAAAAAYPGLPRLALAALIQEKDRMRGKTVAVILSGGNGDRSQMAEILSGATPRVQQDMRRAI